MKTFSTEHVTFTTGAWDFVDITDDVQEVLRDSQIQGGHVTVLAPEADCSLLINERESGLLEDIRRAVERLGEGGRLIGSRSVVLPAVDGKLQLGPWQRVMLLELNPAPSSRSVVVHVVGE